MAEKRGRRLSTSNTAHVQQREADAFSVVPMGTDINYSALQTTQDDEFTLDNLLELAYKLIRSWKFIACMALCFAFVVGMYTVLFITPTYEATSIIYVLSNRDSAINMSDLQLGSELTQDYIKVFEMWEVHEQVISNLNLPYDYTEMEEMLHVTNDSNTRMLDITVTSKDPQEAADIANEYAEVASEYISDTMSTDRPNIMSVARVPSNPVRPRVTVNIIAGFVIGLLLSSGIIVVRTIIDDKYKTADDIRKYTGLVTLAVIPTEEKKNAKGNIGKYERKRT